ncbi:hypothetical protein [Chitinophaga tropicalis]|uniref:Uncharacterized protein n=1 Tax=Chitinophaga tropicalis TaxID=2683588 RepID=A0A7K1U4N9_9BACT|nr:hypothetical protein [Chitinophaga tropicalis]MVT09310.1 hypothetical protein [Chitinophaga tropicalis]
MKKTVLIILTLLVIIAGALLILKKPAALFARESNKAANTYSIQFLNKPPHDIPTDITADQLTLARFAWNEFLALNWKSSYVFSGTRRERGEPDLFWNYTNNRQPYPDLAVWETYNHRVEFRPGDDKMLSFDKIPTYVYKSGTPKADPGIDLHLFNNLDENNEIGSCNLYAYTNKYGEQHQVLYQAKVNRDEYDYIRRTYPTAEQLKQANKTTYNNIQQYNRYYKGSTNTCDCPSAEGVVCLPCGTIPKTPADRNQEGSIEVKTAWRKMLPEDGTADTYFKRKILTYRKDPGGAVRAINDTYLLIGLHIIHKTTRFPNFIYATWEHKDVTSSQVSMGYVKLDSTGKEYGGIITGYPRTHGITHEVEVANNEAHYLLNGANPSSVWKNYFLIGVQSQTTSDSNVPNFFLANYVIESDSVLQLFNGSSIDDPFNRKDNIVYNGVRYSMGGCQGCHGVAQFRLGSDLSFLCDTVNKPVDMPDVGQVSNKRIRYQNAFRLFDKVTNQ